MAWRNGSSTLALDELLELQAGLSTNIFHQVHQNDSKCKRWQASHLFHPLIFAGSMAVRRELLASLRSTKPASACTADFSSISCLRTCLHMQAPASACMCDFALKILVSYFRYSGSGPICSVCERLLKHSSKHSGTMQCVQFDKSNVGSHSSGLAIARQKV